MRDFGAGRREIAQQRQLALADDALRIVAVGAKDAADLAVVIRYRAVGECVVGLFRIAVALHDQQLGFNVGARVAAHGLREHWPDVLPNFTPNHGGGLAERPGMLAADDRFVGIVVKIGQVLAPTDPNRLARGEHDADCGPKTLGPLSRCPQCRTSPVERLHQLSKLAFVEQRTLGTGSDRV